ncbi:MAG: hypothetical protein IJD41_04845 [Alphaproteobacteria bacterium]|nr:hypothetical protein [Alphaproteobacteria bacterium]
MTIEDLAKQLIECRGLELYRLLQILKEMRTDEARARVRAREREYAAKQAWRNCNAKYRQIQHHFKHTHTKKI